MREDEGGGRERRRMPIASKKMEPLKSDVGKKQTKFKRGCAVRRLAFEFSGPPCFIVGPGTRFAHPMLPVVPIQPTALPDTHGL